jgi:hypothetical protein
MVAQKRSVLFPGDSNGVTTALSHFANLSQCMTSALLHTRYSERSRTSDKTKKDPGRFSSEQI